ncbi:MAG: amidase domain-containing protein [Eubacteriaceae bacterium]|jgi:hypothetical protein
MRYFKLIGSFILILLITTGCSVSSVGSAASSVDKTSVTEDSSTGTTSVSGSGEINDETGSLTSEQSGALQDFLNTWYDSLASLKAGDIASKLSDAGSSAKNQAALDYQTAERKMQKTDLSLTGYQYTLNITGVEQNDDNTITVTADEDSVQNFTAYAGIDSEAWGMDHTFVFKNTDGSWKLFSHDSEDSLFQITIGNAPEDQDAVSWYAQREADLEQDAQSDTDGRSTQGTDPGDVSVQVGYDRPSALAYAESLVNDRNPEWGDYTDYDGNCQNFASQVLNAGGIPMDTDGDAIWKWYEDDPDQGSSDYGRSASWTAVNDFLEYASTNTGFGLVAAVDAPFYSGDVGDLIEMGNSDGFEHTVVIANVIKNSSGDTVDYLVDSNTANLRNFPVSAYHYSRQILTRIYGWNMQ